MSPPPPVQTKELTKDGGSPAFKLLIFCVLTLNITFQILLLRYTRTAEGPMYFTTTAVVVIEVMKLFISLSMIVRDNNMEIQAAVQDVYKNVICSPADTLKMCVPSVVYMVQNNLAFVSLSNLDAATFQVTYQLKIVTTALLSMSMLNRKLSATQWFAIVILTAGVACVQLQPDAGKPAKNVNYTVGLTSILASCLCSSFAGVYFEKVLKGSDTTLWVRNVQMYIFGILSGLIGVFTKDLYKVTQHGFFYGYTHWVWTLAVVTSTGGIMTSVIVKYLDNIVKGFSSSVSILLSATFSIYLFGKQLTLLFCIGSLLVCIATYVYSLPAKPPPSESAPTQPPSEEEAKPSDTPPPSPPKIPPV